MKKNTALYLKIASGVIIVIGIVLLVAGIGAGSAVIGVGGVLAVIGVIAGKVNEDNSGSGEKKPKKTRSSSDDDNGSSRQVIFPDKEKILTLTANGRSFVFRHMALVLYKSKVYSVMHLAEKVPELEGMVDEDTNFVFLVSDYDEDSDTTDFTFVTDDDISEGVIAKYEKYKR